jgi:hypothetical protein
MKKDSRAMTTHTTTIELIKEGKIKMVKPKDKPYSQTDYLVINQEDQFNKIYEFLLEIQYLILQTSPTIDKIQTTLHATNITTDFHIHKELEDLNTNFIEAYHTAINLILFDLLPYIHYNIDSGKDSQILRSHIFRLLEIINKQTFTLNIVDQLNRIAYDTLKNVKQTPLTEFNKINLNSVEDIIKTIEKYKDKFLKKPHEKSSR